MLTRSGSTGALLLLQLQLACPSALCARTSRSMVRVVSPDRVVYTLDDEEAVTPLVQQLYPDADRSWRYHLVANLLQL